MFITFEGIEGSGKTSQAERLAGDLERDGYDVLTVREPGGTGIGEAIRDLLKNDPRGEHLVPEAETLLFSASRAQLARTVVVPALERGAIVVCDRFFDSTTAYQGYGRGLDVDAVIGLHGFAADGARPDITILLDLDVEAGFRRLGSRHAADGTQHDRIEREVREFHVRTRAGYLELARRWPDRFRVMDSARDADAVATDIRRVVDQVLEAKGLSNDPG